jgi:WD40 repeat protein
VVSAGNDGTVRVWTWATHAKPVVLRGHQGAVLSVAFSPDGHRVVSTGNDSTLRVWTWAAPGEPVVLYRHPIPFAGTSAEFSSDGQRVVSGGQDWTVRVERCESCAPIQQILRLARSRVTRDLTAEERTEFVPKR